MSRSAGPSLEPFRLPRTGLDLAEEGQGVPALSHHIALSWRRPAQRGPWCQGDHERKAR